MLRKVLTAIILALVAFHLVAVTLAAIPPNRVSTTAAPGTGYLKPYFTQNWRLFAPNPISADRSIEFRAIYKSGDETKKTPWLDWTAVELDLVRHRVIGGRAGYITNKLYSPLVTAYGRLTSEQREIVDSDRETALQGWDQLLEALDEAADKPKSARIWLQYEQAVTALATQAMRAVHPDIEPVAVQYRLVNQRVLPFDARNLPVDVRNRRTPKPVIRESGERLPMPSDAASQRAVNKFWERHR